MKLNGVRSEMRHFLPIGPGVSFTSCRRTARIISGDLKTRGQKVVLSYSIAV